MVNNIGAVEGDPPEPSQSCTSPPPPAHTSFSPSILQPLNINHIITSTYNFFLETDKSKSVRKSLLLIWQCIFDVSMFQDFGFVILK